MLTDAAIRRWSPRHGQTLKRRVDQLDVARLLERPWRGGHLVRPHRTVEHRNLSSKTDHTPWLCRHHLTTRHHAAPSLCSSVEVPNNSLTSKRSCYNPRFKVVVQSIAFQVFISFSIFYDLKFAHRLSIFKRGYLLIQGRPPANASI